MEYIKAKCKTNLDGYDCSKVTLFGCRPIIGDSVEVNSRKGSNVTLKVCRITHRQDGKEPYLEIELHH